MEENITHHIDQYMALMRDTLKCAPPVLLEFYNDLKKEGFNDREALSLTKITLIKMLGGYTNG